jgi:hypothetical protein
LLLPTFTYTILCAVNIYAFLGFTFYGINITTLSSYALVPPGVDPERTETFSELNKR